MSLPRPPGKAIIRLVEGVTARWARRRKAEERDESAKLRRADRLIHRDRPTSIKAAAYSVMEQT